MKCPKCAAEAGSGRFCRSCGAPLAAREAEAEPIGVCPSCGATVLAGAKFCAVCATPLGVAAPPLPAATESVICVYCGAEATGGTKFCKSCGKPIASGAPAPTPDMMPTVTVTPTVRPIAPPIPPRSPQAVPPRRTAEPPTPTVLPVPRSVAKVETPLAPAAPRVATAAGSRTILIGALLIVALAVAGLTYKMVSRRSAAQPSAAVETPPAAQPSMPPSGDAGAAANPESQPATQPDAQTAESTPEPIVPAGAGAGNTAAAGTAHPAPPKAPKRPSPAKPAGPAYTEAHNNAAQALAGGQYVSPADGSALFWARKAKALGDPAAAPIEQQVFTHQMAAIDTARQSHNYDQVRALIFELAGYFPDHAELRQLQADVQQEEQKLNQQQEEQRRQAQLQAQTKKFAVQHRHGTGGSFCVGLITVTPDGTGRYDCNTADSGGRCEHVIFAAGSLKEVKVRGDGSLHIATRGQGNFDFNGGEFAIKDAATALAPLVKK